MLNKHARLVTVTASAVGVALAASGALAGSAAARTTAHGNASASASGFAASRAVPAVPQEQPARPTNANSGSVSTIDTTTGKVATTMAVGKYSRVAITDRPPHAVAAPAVCASSRNPDLADVVSRDIIAALAGRTSTVAVAVADPGTGVTCGLRADRHFDSASVVKVTILAALLRQTQEQHRRLTHQEDQRAIAMITKSDNAAATALWRQLGRAAVQHFLQLAAMSQTVLGSDGHWGLTQITGLDQLKLLSLLDNANTVLSDASRGYVLNLMSRVVPAQRWGTPAGAPAGVRIQVKNGWMSRATHGWRINSIGSFAGPGRTYEIVVLTQDNASMAYGVTTVERVARAVHKDLNPG